MENEICILAVDDSSVNLAMIDQELRGKYDVVTVNSGMRALQFLRVNKPDLILLDIQMALKDGIETLREIRNLDNGANIPVIMLTAKKDRESIIESSKLGVYDYVLKPFNGEDLHKRITKTLKRAGVIAAEPEELYELVRDVQKVVRAGDIQNAISKINAVLKYQLDEEIYGRLHAAKSKLQTEDEETARRLLSRVIKILEKTMNPGERVKSPITVEQTKERLQRILDALEKFKVKDAAAILNELLSCDISTLIVDSCEEASEKLAEYDDGAAEELIRKALAKLQESSES